MIKIEINSEIEIDNKINPISFENNIKSQNDESIISDKTMLFYNNSKNDISKLDKSILAKYLPKILSKNTIEKYFTESDLNKLKEFLPKSLKSSVNFV